MFAGIHEVRAKTPQGIFAGYFNSEPAALAAVERLDYTAAWATLSPLRSDALTPDTVINAELVRTYNTAADSHILRREWLLLDFDPPRPTGTNATDAEKAAAHQQAEECRDGLDALGWPSPAVIDSGNGYHLRYRINLPNDAAAHELVRGVLRSLARRYSMLDVTNHNAARVAKLPGTWARKAKHTPERPRRVSALLSEGSGTVTEAQLQAIAGDVTAREFAAPQEITSEEAKAAREWLLGYLEHYALVARTPARRMTGGWKIGIYCPLTERDEEPHDDAGETSTILQIINGKLSFKCSHNTCELAERNTMEFKAEMTRRNPDPYKPEPGQDGKVVFGRRTLEAVPKHTDWRDRYMTADAFQNIKPPEFLIADFLVKGSITMLAGPVAQRKSIIALNIAHACCTGDALFGYFDVPEKPSRVVYLCPEMGAASFTKRIKQIGLGGYVGERLFIQTMSEQSTRLDDLDGELPGAVVLIDTITRFVEGDENQSADMRLFAEKVFRLVKAGATVILLHHSKKGSTGSLDDGLRGSSELAAFVDSCWVTELEEMKKPYESLSKMRNVKQRDFECDPFRLKPAPGSYYLTMEGEPAPEAVIKSKKEAAAREALAEILKDSPKMGINKLIVALRAKGHGRGAKWVTKERGELLGTGATLTAA